LAAENLTQGTARDVFGEALLRVERKFPVCLHVHDELVVAVPDAEAKSAAAEITRLMSLTPEWLPGCPIAAEAVISKHYVK
jgi:DNA polymerase